MWLNHNLFLILQSKTPALVFEYINNTDFKVSLFAFSFCLYIVDLLKTRGGEVLDLAWIRDLRFPSLEQRDEC